LNEQNTRVIEDGKVVTLNYTLRVDGVVVDTSDDGKPIQFIQGQQHIIPGLEDELYGLEIGAQKEVVVPPEKGYGQLDPENYADIPREQFPDDIPLEPGLELEVREDSGKILTARIEGVTSDAIRLDFNHPLAGKELHFSVMVVDLRSATDEEMSHGHVHEDEHSHEE
jgi:FKBP-type peptidyl-prolyl cis-trans isomerase SlyD